MTLAEVYLEQKIALVEKFYQITERLFDLVKNQQFSDLAALFGEREEIITEINYIDQIYQNKCDLNDTSIPLIQENVIKLRDLLQTVQKIDVELVKMLKILLEDGQKELSQIKIAQKVHAAYNSYTQQGLMLDKHR